MSPQAPARPRGAKARAALVMERLGELYPDASTALHFEGPWQLLVAVALSAQCTDRIVNEVTPGLFARWPDPASLAAAPLDELEAVLHSVNYYRSKARHLQGAARLVLERHGGAVPADMAALVELPGVGRKSANVILGGAFGRAEGVVVDTHVARLSRLLGLSAAQDPLGIERDLVALLPRRLWIPASHRLILHGRAVCVARRPRCGLCCLADLCPSARLGPAPAGPGSPGAS